MTKKFPFINIGTNSIMTIFVLLCMVTFATLACLTVRKDSNFQAKEMQRKENYHQASNEAQKQIAKIDQELKLAWENGTYDEVQEIYEFQVELDDDFILAVEMQKCNPEENEGHFYRLTRYQETMQRSWEGDDTVDLIEFD